MNKIENKLKVIHRSTVMVLIIRFNPKYNKYNNYRVFYSKKIIKNQISEKKVLIIGSGKLSGILLASADLEKVKIVRCINNLHLFEEKYRKYWINLRATKYKLKNINYINNDIRHQELWNKIKNYTFPTVVKIV